MLDKKLQQTFLDDPTGRAGLKVEKEFGHHRHVSPTWFMLSQKLRREGGGTG